MRVVVDTNVWISAALNRQGPPRRVVRLLQRDRFTLVSSQELIDEFTIVIGRKRFAWRVQPEDVAELDEVMGLLAHRVIPAEVERLVRDASDDIVVATALAGRANVTVHATRTFSATLSLWNAWRRKESRS